MEATHRMRNDLPDRLEAYIGGLIIGQGRYAGEPFPLQTWQKKFIKGAFSQAGDAGISLARGGGKTTFIAGIACAAVDVDGPLVEPMGECLVIASSFDQGLICFRVQDSANRATITPDTPETKALTPSIRAHIGRYMIRKGESLLVIEVLEGKLELRIASDWDVLSYGGTREKDWRYTTYIYSPSNTQALNLPSDAVVHCRYAVDALRPWLGVGPLGFADTTASLMSNLESKLSMEAGGPVGHVLAVPLDPGKSGAKGRAAAQLIYSWAGARAKLPVVPGKDSYPDRCKPWRILLQKSYQKILTCLTWLSASISSTPPGTYRSAQRVLPRWSKAAWICQRQRRCPDWSQWRNRI